MSVNAQLRESASKVVH